MCPEDDFNKPTNRNKTQLFNQENKFILGSNKNKVVKTIEVSRNTIGRLLSQLAMENSLILRGL